MTLDISLYNWLHAWAGRSPFSDAAIIFTASYLPWIMAVGAICYFIVSNRPPGQKITKAAEAAAALLLGRLVITGGIRYFVHRARPFMLPNAHPLFVTTGTSFPSAHATMLFAAGLVLLAYNKRAGGIFLGLSLLVCLARIVAGVHYPADILAGIAAGLAAGVAVLAVSSAFAKYRLADAQKSQTPE